MEGKGGREAATEGQAPIALGSAGQAGGAAGRREGAAGKRPGAEAGRRGGIYLALSRHRSGRGKAAPRSVARQTLPRHRSTPRSSPRHPSRRATIHGAAQAFRRAREIDAAKSISFGEKN